MGVLLDDAYQAYKALTIFLVLFRLTYLSSFAAMIVITHNLVAVTLHENIRPSLLLLSLSWLPFHLLSGGRSTLVSA